MEEQTDPVADEPQLTGPERRCVATGQILPKTRLLRFVVSPDGEVVVDIAQRLPGRGIWLFPSRDVVNTALGKKVFARAARRQVQIPADLADRIEALLVARCLSTLGMARRSGQAVTGFEKVKAEIQAGRAKVLVEASDGAKDGSSKIRALGRELPVVDLLDSSELGGVFGRDAAIHGALAPGALARNLLDQAGLLAGFRARREGPPDAMRREAPPSVV